MRRGRDADGSSAKPEVVKFAFLVFDQCATSKQCRTFVQRYMQKCRTMRLTCHSINHSTTKKYSQGARVKKKKKYTTVVTEDEQIVPRAACQGACVCVCDRAPDRSFSLDTASRARVRSVVDTPSE